MSTPSLASLQHTLQGYLLNQHNDTHDLTTETANFSKQQRLGIYHDAYRLRLIDALSNDYPALQLMLGESVFSPLMIEYIEKYPSLHPSLRWFGANMPQFLAEHSNWGKQIAIVELATFEWAQIMTFDAANTPPATLSDLRALPTAQWLTLQLVFQPAIQIIQCNSNAPSLWNALIKEGASIDLEYEDQPRAWLVWRENLHVIYRPLDEGEAWCMQAFLRGDNFSQVCEGLCDWFPTEQVPLKTAQYLQQWLQSELIKSVLSTP